jgi:SAM-dependent methyltransferase
MGIARLSARMLLREAKERPFCGSVLTLGNQTVMVSDKDFATWAKQHGVPLREGKHVFQRMGAESVVSCDVSSYEGADFLLDLNAEPNQSREHGPFDLIFDGGTLEHVFHLPNALSNIHAMLAAGGRVIHASPTSNYVDHGFYSFSPTFFWDYYEANGYRIEACYLTAQAKNQRLPHKVFRYRPMCVESRAFGGFSAREFGESDIIDTFFVATKTPSSTSGVVPMQGHCRKAWAGGNLGDEPGFEFVGEI